MRVHALPEIGGGPQLHVLVAYASKHGSTREIAETIAEQLARAGLEVDCLAAKDVRGVAEYDAVVLGSAVYMRRWMRDARRLLSRESRELANRPLWVFSSGPCGQDPDWSWAEPPRTIGQAMALGARGHVAFGGRVPPDPTNFMERSMLRDTPPEHRDLRDWDQIRAWAADVGAAVAGAASAVAS